MQRTKLSGKSVRLLCRALTQVLAFMLASQQLLAQDDHPLLSSYPESELLEVELEEEVTHRLVMGALQRIRGRVEPEESERVRGDLSKLLYEIREGYTGEDAYRFFAEQFAERGYQILFECSGRACGSSNYWANDVFKNRILYGPERNQYYLIARIPGDGFDPYVSVYIITRGNRRIYAYLEILEGPGEGRNTRLVPPNQFNQLLMEAGFLSLADINFNDADGLVDTAGLDELLAALRANPELSIYVVGNFYEAHYADDLSLLQTRSRRRAQAVATALIEQGIAVDRLSVQGIGPLSPGCAETSCRNRIDVVLQVDQAHVADGAAAEASVEGNP